MTYNECPQCWAGSSRMKEYETDYHYIVECGFCATIIVTRKDTKTGLEEANEE